MKGSEKKPKSAVKTGKHTPAYQVAENKDCSASIPKKK